MRNRLAPALALPALLGACVSGGPPSPPPRPEVGTPPSEPIVTPAPRREAGMLNLPGLEGVIGEDAGTLVRLFGQPRLDLREGDARKLQFVGEACVLDIFLYPTARSREPIATYLDARRASDGLDVDRAACVRALRR